MDLLTRRNEQVPGLIRGATAATGGVVGNCALVGSFMRRFTGDRAAAGLQETGRHVPPINTASDRLRPVGPVGH